MLLLLLFRIALGLLFSLNRILSLLLVLERTLGLLKVLGRLRAWLGS